MFSTIRLATPADDAALRRLLRDSPMPGSISLTYEREPDYFIAARMEGALSQTLVKVEDATGEIEGMGTRIVRPMYLNGGVREIGYMSHARADLSRPWGMSLARQLVRGFQKFRELHEDGRVPFYLMSIIADNLPARRLLTSGLPGMPAAREYTRLFTYAIAPRHPRPAIPLPHGMQLRGGMPEDIPAIVDCLQSNGRRMQFSPFWSTENLFTAQTPNLRPDDFFLAWNGSHVAGCLGIWDQNRFKQTVVRGYRGSLARWRWAVPLLRRFVDVPPLPTPGTPLRYCYISHLAIDDDDPRLFASLLRCAYNETIRRGFDYFLIGLAEANPLRSVLMKNYLHITYPSQLYLMAWEDGLDLVEKVDGRLPGLEIALL